MKLRDVHQKCILFLIRIHPSYHGFLSIGNQQIRHFEHKVVSADLMEYFLIEIDDRGLAFYQHDGLAILVNQCIKSLFFLIVNNLPFNRYGVTWIIEVLTQLVKQKLAHFFFRCGHDAPLSEGVKNEELVFINNGLNSDFFPFKLHRQCYAF